MKWAVVLDIDVQTDRQAKNEYLLAKMPESHNDNANANDGAND